MRTKSSKRDKIVVRKPYVSQITREAAGQEHAPDEDLWQNDLDKKRPPRVGTPNGARAQVANTQTR